MTKYAKLLGVGSGLPKKCVTNADLVAQLDAAGVGTSESWIQTRTGICQRYIASEGETTTGLAEAAAIHALERASRSAADVDAIVVATSTSDQIFPSTACALQARLGANRAFAFDVLAVCSGFVYALTVANSMIRSGQVRSALVVGAEVFSRIIDWNDRSTCVLFGDGAGAVYLEASDQPGILGCNLHSEGDLACILNASGRVESGKVVGDPFLRMDGQAVFRKAVAVLEQSALQALSDAGLRTSDLDLFIPHQANVRILQAVGKKMALNPSQLVETVGQFGNTSAASVPLALDVAFGEGRVQSGNLVLLQGVGGGFTWGSVLVRM